MKRESVSYVTELNLIMEKGTAFSKHAPYCIETMGELCNLRNKASKDCVIREKDLSEEKDGFRIKN